jgi:hypothetical protein
MCIACLAVVRSTHVCGVSRSLGASPHHWHVQQHAHRLALKAVSPISTYALRLCACVPVCFAVACSAPAAGGCWPQCTCVQGHAQHTLLGGRDSSSYVPGRQGEGCGGFQTEGFEIRPRACYLRCRAQSSEGSELLCAVIGGCCSSLWVLGRLAGLPSSNPGDGEMVLSLYLGNGQALKLSCTHPPLCHNRQASAEADEVLVSQYSSGHKPKRLHLCSCLLAL